MKLMLKYSRSGRSYYLLEEYTREELKKITDYAKFISKECHINMIYWKDSSPIPLFDEEVEIIKEVIQLGL